LAEWRILDYGQKAKVNRHMVTFSYKEREYLEVKWTVPIEKFISLLIYHIPPKHFRVVRYYRALATRTKSLFKKILGKLFRRMIQISKKPAHLKRTFISLTGKNPLRCPLCQREMKLVEVAYFSKQIKFSGPLPPSVAISQPL